MIKEYKNINISNLTTFRFPITVKKYIEIENETDLEKIDFKKTPTPIQIIGFGSNLFFENKKFLGTIIKFTGSEWELLKETKKNVIIKVQAGLKFDHLVEIMTDHNWTGLENLSRIPSSVGASAIQNIGAYGTEVKDYIYSVSGFFLANKRKITLDNNACNFSYRNSIFKTKKYKDFLITEVCFKLNKVFKPILHYPALLKNFPKGVSSAKEVRDFLIKLRDSKFPDWNKVGNVGSFFKNPIITKKQSEYLKINFPDLQTYETENLNKVKISAGYLIEKAGFKGYEKNNIGVSKDHALVLVNYGGKNKDMIKLVKKITDNVFTKFKIKLEPEAIIIK